MSSSEMFESPAWLSTISITGHCADTSSNVQPSNHHHFSQSTLLLSIPGAFPKTSTNSSVIIGGPQTYTTTFFLSSSGPKQSNKSPYSILLDLCSTLLLFTGP